MAMTLSQARKEIERLEKALRATGRTVEFCGDNYVSVPMHDRQNDAAKEYFEDRRYFDEFNRTDEGREYAEIHTEGARKFGFDAVLVKWESDQDGNETSSLQILGLIKV